MDLRKEKMADPTAKDETVRILGISKKMHLELAEMEIQNHIAVVNVLVQLCQHRTATLEKQLNDTEQQRRREMEFGPHKVARVS
jgi:hypothetical protein